MFFSAILLAALPLAARAQGVTHTVIVGDGGELRYNPETVVAAIGDTIEFTFRAKNHTATQAAFATPCSPLSGGFNSGFRPVGANVTGDFPTASYNVEVSTPIWFYCAQTNPASHCESGMVFAVNPPTNGTNTFAAFQAHAIALANSTTTTAAASATSNVSIPPAVSLVTVTETITVDTTPYTTTYGSYPGSPQPTVDVTPQVFPVAVGFNGTLTYNPSVVNANIGDIVSFTFSGKNHTATQTSFNAPCVPALTSSGVAVFDTGFEPIGAGVAPVTVNYTVTTENPTWFACMQTNPVDHCGSGMVFAVNPPPPGNDHSFQAFQALAIQLNGTGSSTGSASASASTPTSTNKSGGTALRVGVGLSIGLVAAVFALLL